MFVWEGEFDRSAGEVNERERGVGGVNPVGAADDQLHAVVQRLGSSVAQLQPSGGEDPVAVFADRAAEPDEWFQAAAGQGASSRSISVATVCSLRPGAKIARTISFIAQARGTVPPAACSAASVSAWRSVRS